MIVPAQMAAAGGPKNVCRFYGDQAHGGPNGPVYTADQAKRGEAIFKDNCSVCHAEDLTGADGPALKGELFTLLWEGRSLGRLFQRVRRMPPRRAALPLEESRDALAFILQANGYPAGERELSTDGSLLDEITIAAKP